MDTRITDEIHVRPKHIEQAPMTLFLRGRRLGLEDGYITLRIPRAAYDDDEVEQRLTALGEDLLTVLENHGF